MASRWSHRTDPIVASALRKMDADSGGMRGAGWSNGSSLGSNGNAAFLSAGSFIPRTSLASCNSPVSSSSSNDFEIGSRESKRTCACAHCWLQIVELRRARAHQLRGIEQVGRIPLRRVFGHDVDRGSGQMVAEQGNNFCRLPALAGLVDLLVLAVGAAKDVGEPGLHAVIDVTLAALSSPIPAPLQQRIGAAE